MYNGWPWNGIQRIRFVSNIPIESLCSATRCLFLFVLFHARMYECMNELCVMHWSVISSVMSRHDGNVCRSGIGIGHLAGPRNIDRDQFSQGCYFGLTQSYSCMHAQGMKLWMEGGGLLEILGGGSFLTCHAGFDLFSTYLKKNIFTKSMGRGRPPLTPALYAHVKWAQWCSDWYHIFD